MLSTIATLKVGEISSWIKERRGDAEMTFNMSLAQLVLKEPSNTRARMELMQWMNLFQRTYNYSTIALFDSLGKICMVAPSHADIQSQSLNEHISKGLKAREVVFVDIHRANPNDPILLYFLVPIGLNPKNSQKANGLLILSVNPNEYLYPLLKRWPTPSQSAETMLIRREGNQVVCLNEVRHKKGSALSLRLPMRRPDLPYGRLTLNQATPVEDVDYRGIPVLATLLNIKGTPWFIVSKIDLDEIYYPVRQKAWAVGLIVGLLILISILGVGILWRNQKLMFTRRELAEQKLSEAKLRESEIFKSKMVAHIGDVIAIFDNEGINRYVSPNIEILFGWKPDELIGSNALEKVHPVNLETTKNFINSIRSENGKFGSTEIKYMFKDENYTWIEFVACNLLNDPIINGFLVNFHDISERKRAEEELINANKQLANLDNAKNYFIGLLSHELRTPLIGINGNATMIKEISTDIDIIDSCQDILDSEKRLRKFVELALLITSIKADNIETNLNFENIFDFIETSINLIKPLAESKKITFIIEINNREQMLKSDYSLICKVFNFIIENAVKFSPENSSVEIKDKFDDKNYKLLIKDLGTGFTDDFLENKLEMLQVGNLLSHTEGTGLSLFASKTIMELHGFKLVIGNDNDKGAIVELIFPNDALQ